MINFPSTASEIQSEFKKYGFNKVKFFKFYYHVHAMQDWIDDGRTMEEYMEVVNNVVEFEFEVDWNTDTFFYDEHPYMSKEIDEESFYSDLLDYLSEKFIEKSDKEYDVTITVDYLNGHILIVREKKK